MKTNYCPEAHLGRKLCTVYFRGQRRVTYRSSRIALLISAGDLHDLESRLTTTQVEVGRTLLGYNCAPLFTIERLIEGPDACASQNHYSNDPLNEQRALDLARTNDSRLQFLGHLHSHTSHSGDNSLPSARDQNAARSALSVCQFLFLVLIWREATGHVGARSFLLSGANPTLREVPFLVVDY
jgi:hypothetical protein